MGNLSFFHQFWLFLSFFGPCFSAQSFVPFVRSPFRHRSLLTLIFACHRIFLFHCFHTRSDPLSIITSPRQNIYKTITKFYTIIQLHVIFFFCCCCYSCIIYLFHLHAFYDFPLCMNIFGVFFPQLYCVSISVVCILPLPCVIVCVCFRLPNTVFFPPLGFSWSLMCRYFSFIFFFFVCVDTAILTFTLIYFFESPLSSLWFLYSLTIKPIFFPFLFCYWIVFLD